MINNRTFFQVPSLAIVCMFSLQALSAVSPNHVTIGVYKESLEAIPEFQFSGPAKEAFLKLPESQRQDVLAIVVRKAAANAPYSQKIYAGLIGAKKVLIGFTVAAGLTFLAGELNARNNPGISVDKAHHRVRKSVLLWAALGAFTTYLLNPRLAHETAIWIATSNLEWLVETLSSWHGDFTTTYDLDSGKLVS